MRRAPALACLAVLSLAPPGARGAPVDLRFLGGVDFLGATTPQSAALEAGQIGITIRGDARNLAGGKIDLRLDFREQIDLQDPASSRNEVHHLSATFRRLAGRLDLTLGRFAAPGGFWLTTDGALARLHLGEVFAIEAFGGVRGYTSGRTDAWITPCSSPAKPVAPAKFPVAASGVCPLFLPVAGAALTVDHSIVRAVLAATFAEDAIESHRGFSFAGGVVADDGTSAGVENLEFQKTQEMFVDAQVLMFAHPTLLLTGGATLGSRYLLTYSSVAGQFTAAPSVDNQFLQSFMGYAVAEWRPWKRLKIAYSFDFDRVKIVTPVLPLDNTLAAAGGSFEDHTLKVGVRIWRALRAEARYRLRFRENSDLIHRFEGRVDGDNLVAGVGAFFSLGGDVYQIDPAARALRNRFPGSATPVALVYTGGLSFVHPHIDLRAGVLYTDAIGAGIAFSTHATQAMDAGPTTELFPLSLAAQRIAFLRAFFNYRGIYAGIDAELNLDASQFRALAQAGYAL